jgi:hypothetical protein
VAPNATSTYSVRCRQRETAAPTTMGSAAIALRNLALRFSAVGDRHRQRRISVQTRVQQRDLRVRFYFVLTRRGITPGSRNLEG